MTEPKLCLDDLLDVLTDSPDLCPDYPDDATTWTGPNRVLRVESRPGGFDIGSLAIDGHPSNVLLGYVAPASVAALGVLSYGWAGPHDGGRPSTNPAAVRVRVISFVDRHGLVVSRISGSDGSQMTDPPSEGLVLECLQRSLGVPTKPAAETSAPLFAGVWLATIIEVAHSHGRRLRWAEVAPLHPATAIWPGLSRQDEGSDATPDQIGQAARELRDILPWSELRWLAVTNGWAPLGIDPSLAAWMDDGMFARTMLFKYDVARLAEEVDRLVTARTRVKIARVLTAIADGDQAAA